MEEVGKCRFEHQARVTSNPSEGLQLGLPPQRRLGPSLVGASTSTLTRPTLSQVLIVAVCIKLEATVM